MGTSRIAGSTGLRIRRRFFGALNRPGLRSLLSLAGTAYLVARRRERCLVFPHGDLWVNRYRSGTVVHPLIGGRSPDELAVKTHDEFLHLFIPRPGDTVVDVGAGVGDETLELSRLVGPGGNVISIEAHPKTCYCLRLNVELNRLRNVEIVQGLITDVAGVARISDLDAHISNSIFLGSTKSIAVPSMTLDALVSDFHLGDIALLKMNIEGAELRALRGMTNTIRSVRNVAIACHDFVAERTNDESHRTLEGVGQFLTAHGFRLSRRASDPRPWVRDTIYGER